MAAGIDGPGDSGCCLALGSRGSVDTRGWRRGRGWALATSAALVAGRARDGLGAFLSLRSRFRNPGGRITRPAGSTRSFPSAIAAVSPGSSDLVC